MKRIISILIFSTLGLLIINGCEQDTASSLSEEQLEEQAILEVVQDENLAESDYLADWGIDDENEDNMFNGFSSFSPGNSLPKITTPIENVLRFGRKLNRRIPRTVVFRRVSPDTIMVYLERIWTGGFFVFEGLGDSVTPPDTMVLHRKPLVHVVKKKALFTRNSDLSDELTTANRGWKLSAISLGQGWSRPVSTLEIHRVEINTSSGETYMFENPDETMLGIPEDIPLAVKGEKVRVTVQVSNTTDAPVYHPETGATETLLLHYGINRFHHARRQFEFKGVDPQSGYNLYQGEWTVHEPALRPFHAVVDAIDNGTIYDEDGEYNSATWGFPYRVVLSK